MPETEEAQVQSFVEETATHSSIFSGKFNGQKSVRPWALKEFDMTKHAHTHTHTHTHTPLCLVWRNVYWGLLPIFSTRFFVFCCCSYWTVWAVCIFSKLSSCWVASFVNIFSHSVGWLEICLWFPLLCKSLKIWLDTFSLFFYYFISIAVGDWTKKTLVQFMSNSFAYDLS